MDYARNTWRGTGLPDPAPAAVRTDPAVPQALYRMCPKAHETPLIDAVDLAHALGVGRLWLKDERQRLGLGSFKALGAAYVIASQAEAAVRQGRSAGHDRALSGETFICASAGNHGLSVAAGARLFGARAVVYLAETVPEAFADRLRAKGAEVMRAGTTYEESMAAAAEAADGGGGQLLSDSSWPGYCQVACDVMEGYLIMGAEAAGQLAATGAMPTHIFLQAGVGGLAAACTAAARRAWGDAPRVILVEPDRAPALTASLAAGRPVTAPGPVSAMGRLDCKEPSLVALHYLAREADGCLTVSDDAAGETVRWLAGHGLDSTPSGVAGLAGLRHAGAARAAMRLDGAARVLVYLSEAPEDGGPDGSGAGEDG